MKDTVCLPKVKNKTPNNRHLQYQSQQFKPLVTMNAKHCADFIYLVVFSRNRKSHTVFNIKNWTGQICVFGSF